MILEMQENGGVQDRSKLVSQHNVTIVYLKAIYSYIQNKYISLPQFLTVSNLLTSMANAIPYIDNLLQVSEVRFLIQHYMLCSY